MASEPLRLVDIASLTHSQAKLLAKSVGALWLVFSVCCSLLYVVGLASSMAPGCPACVLLLLRRQCLEVRGICPLSASVHHFSIKVVEAHGLILHSYHRHIIETCMIRECRLDRKVPFPGSKSSSRFYLLSCQGQLVRKSLVAPPGVDRFVRAVCNDFSEELEVPKSTNC